MSAGGPGQRGRPSPPPRAAWPGNWRPSTSTCPPTSPNSTRSPTTWPPRSTPNWPPGTPPPGPRDPAIRCSRVTGAAGLTVNAAVVDDPQLIAASDTATLPDATNNGGNAQAMAELFNVPTGPDQQYQSLIQGLGSQVQAMNNQVTAQTSVANAGTTEPPVHRGGQHQRPDGADADLPTGLPGVCRNW